MFSFKWKLSDLEEVPSCGLKVFSCFSGGGGSSMGYKMSGIDVVGFCESDEFMAKTYLNNMKVKHPFIMPIQKLLTEDLPDELYNIDILDGSPPCTNFSKANKLGKKNTIKLFKEGKTKQHLESLSLMFVNLAKILNPKIVIIENVPDIFNKKNYTNVFINQIYNPLSQYGYNVFPFVFNAKYMGVPQSRARAFIIAGKSRFFEKLSMKFNDRVIPIKEISNKYEPRYTHKKGKVADKINLYQPGKRLTKDVSFFSYDKVPENKPFYTLTSGQFTKPENINYDFSIEGLLQGQSFRLDYKFLPGTSKTKKKYLIGMSVPPLMIHRIVEEIKKQWI